jgi:hypothetical protein
LPWPKSAVRDWTHKALAANSEQPAEHQIRIVVTGGVGPDPITPSADRPTLIIFSSIRTVRIRGACTRREPLLSPPITPGSGRRPSRSTTSKA